jgi:RNA methyltransferase, TrmH family
MISKAQIKWVKSLQVKKYRQAEQRFMVQGMKGVEELVQSDFEVEWVAGTETACLALRKSMKRSIQLMEASAKELEAMGSFQSNDSILAVAIMRQNQIPKPVANEYFLVLDDIRDPGNLGTIIRTADWYGIKHIMASEHTADFYNPKVISATMGSFCRVHVGYTDLLLYLRACDVPVYGAFLSGNNIHNEHFATGGLLTIGNESNGISPAVEQYVRHRIYIPGAGNAESLNAAIATGIILDNVFRGRSAY